MREDLEILALVVAELGLVHRELWRFLSDAGAGAGPHHGLDQLVDLLLGVILDLLLGRARALDEGGNLVRRGYFRA